MKTFKQLISEVQEPQSEGEKNFKGLHNPVNHKDLVPGVTDQDHIFNGSMQRKDPKTASYEDKASEQAYDQTLKIKNSEKKKKGTQTDLNMEEQASLDEKTLTSAEMRKREEIVKSLKKKGMEKSKAYAIATATAKRVAEENLDELSKQTLGSYINKAASSAAKSSYKIMKDKPENAAKHGMDSFKRLEGIKKATAKMAEESEQIDEVSSKTVMSYGIKATAEIGKGNLSTDKESKRMAGMKMADEKMRKKEGKSSTAKIAAEEVEHINEEDRDEHFEKQSKKMQDAINLHLRRGKSYDEAVKAAKKHVKEEAEQIDEISQEKKDKYIKGAMDSYAHANNVRKNADSTGDQKTANKMKDLMKKRNKGMTRAFGEENELDEARRGRPRKDGTKPAGDEEGGREHIIVQLRKVVNLRGQKHVEFNDNSKHEVGVEHAKKALAMHDNLKRAEDKQNLANQLAKSHSSFKNALAGKMETPKKKGVSLAGMKNEAVSRNSQDIDPESGSADSTTMRSDRGAIKTYTTIGADGRMKLVKHREHAKEVKIGESVEMNPKNAKKMIKHDCAKHVLHKEWGNGETIEGMHTIVETSESEGYVTHYDVMFEHGIEQNVPVEDLQIITMVEHMHDNKKSKMEGKEHTIPKTAKEKSLAALAEPKDKITHKDILVGRGVIKKGVKEALEMNTKTVKDAASFQTKTSEPSKENMQQDSLNKMKTDPLACKDTGKVIPPTQGNKEIGGEENPSRVGGKYSMEEQKLMKLYDSLSEENKSVFEALIESENGIEKLLSFAEELGL